MELVDGGTATEAELLAHAHENVGERAAHPRHLEILPELPKTAVGKVFKPELRKMAILRIYNAALKEKGIDAEVVEVSEDKKRGLVAHVRRGDEGVSEEDVQAILGRYARPWGWAP